MEAASDVELTIEDGVARILLDAPDRRNAITLEMADALVATADRVDADPTVGAAVVAATGPVFCAGGDRALLARIGKRPASSESYEALGRIYDAFSRIQSMQMPTIAAVRGAAVGAGLNLVLSTDLRIVAADAVLRSGFLPIGVHPGGGHFTLVSRQAGREAAVAMGIFSQAVTGERAVELGLAWEALPETEVEPRAFELARSVASDPELARAAVASFRAQDVPGRVDVARGLAVERAPQMWSLLRSTNLRP